MNNKDLFLLLVGLVIIFSQSLFLVLWPLLILFSLISWQKESWWLIFLLGLINDLFFLEPLGKTLFLSLPVILIVMLLKKLFSFAKTPKIDL